jgi:hypothetical protein
MWCFGRAVSSCDLIFSASATIPWVVAVDRSSKQNQKKATSQPRCRMTTGLPDECCTFPSEMQTTIFVRTNLYRRRQNVPSAFTAERYDRGVEIVLRLVELKGTGQLLFQFLSDNCRHRTDHRPRDRSSKRFRKVRID